ncbi:MAG: DUF3078 domain-containing protein [Muribaculaceae bacterium]|nr:DUF3078 domain-containing protein [Muribaculaceae bacterium]
MKTLLLVISLFCAVTVSAVEPVGSDSAVVAVDSIPVGTLSSGTVLVDTLAVNRIKTWTFTADSIVIRDVVTPINLPSSFFGTVVYDRYVLIDSVDMMDAKRSGLDGGPLSWTYRWQDIEENMRRVKQRYMIDNPDKVKYNVAMLPEPPKEFHAVVDPAKSTIAVGEISVDKNEGQVDAAVEIKKRNWLHSFDGSLHFSQAYISPNWYQGGNNNLNMIANAVYNIKLNQAFHPNLLFDTTVQYKLAMNSAPDDSLRNYSISEDLFQVNSKFGIRAANRWFYSLALTFKTQLLNSYKSNTNDMTAAFLSPGELNVGVGMTYNFESPKKNLTFDASVSPLSYNVKMCTDSRLDETAFGIEEGHRSVSQIGSSAECKFWCKLAWNITYTSRLFVFSDYEYVQGDWENTVDFSINRYLSTQIYVHLRYDSSTARLDDTSWHRWQLKEILSFGVSYKFSSI